VFANPAHLHPTLMDDLFETNDPSTGSPDGASLDGASLDGEEGDAPGGTITDLQVQKNDSDRISVFVDGEFAFGVHQDVVVKHHLSVGQRLDPETKAAVQADEQKIEAKQTALDYLAYKPRTETEVRRKLRDNDVDRPVIEDVVARLYELGYLDDEEYAHDYAHNRYSNKGYGPIRIRRELVKRGIDRPLADRAVDELFAEVDPTTAAREHAEKYWPRVAGDDDPRRQKKKLHDYLRRRGFTADTIYPILDEFVD
jgi:regulatory protein